MAIGLSVITQFIQTVGQSIFVGFDLSPDPLHKIKLFSFPSHFQIYIVVLYVNNLMHLFILYCLLRNCAN
jgi:hypothetical protein